MARRKAGVSPIGRKPPPRAAFAVRYFELSDWPSIDPDKPLFLPKWVQVPLDPEEGGPPHTIFQPARLWTRGEFQKLDVEHERIRRGYHGPFFNQDWRVNDRIVEYLIERYHFTAYLPASHHGIFMRANSTVAQGALRRVRDSYQTAFHRRSIDVKAFMDCMETTVTKAWWKEMRLPNVQSASLAGPDVNKSLDFARFMDEGELAAAVLIVKWQGHPHRVMVSDTNTIFFYMEDEVRAISLADHVNRLLEACPGVITSTPLRSEPTAEDEEDDIPETTAGFDTPGLVATRKRDASEPSP